MDNGIHPWQQRFSRSCLLISFHVHLAPLYADVGGTSPPPALLNKIKQTMNNMNNTKQLNINFNSQFSGLSFTGSWELVDSGINPATIIRTDQAAHVNVQMKVSGPAAPITCGRFPIKLVAWSADPDLARPQVGEIAMVRLTASGHCGSAGEYEVSITLPPGTLLPGSYRLQPEAWMETLTGEALEVNGFGEELAIKVLPPFSC